MFYQLVLLYHLVLSVWVEMFVLVWFFMLLGCASQPLAFLPDPRLDWENIPVVPALIPAWECELVVPLHYATPDCSTLLLCHPLTVRLYLLLVQSPAIIIPSIPLTAPPT